MSNKILALVIDDHPVVRDGIRRALESRPEYEVILSGSKSEAMAQIAAFDPDLIFVDINLPDGNGLEIVTWVRSISKKVAIIVLTLHDEDEYVLAAMKAGASAYLKKSESIATILNFVDLALKSPQAFSAQSIAPLVLRQEQRSNLSDRELEILLYLKSGNPIRELSIELFIAESTLKKHLSSIYRKLGAANRIQALEKARIIGLLK